MHAEVIALDGAEGVFNARPSARVPLISVKLDTCDDAEEGLRCAASGLHPQQRTHGVFKYPAISWHGGLTSIMAKVLFGSFSY
jgi:hypothetical protein